MAKQADNCITSLMTYPIINLLMISITIIFMLASTISDQHIHSHTRPFSSTRSPRKLGLMSQEKLTHLHFYCHNIVSERNPSAVNIAGTEAADDWPETGFGAVTVIDDPLTAWPEIGSKQVGRAQGMYASASQSEEALLMVLNFAFTECDFNGSNLSILGRNAGGSAVRELPVVGGSGVFRFARGFAQARTYSYEPKSGNSVVEYNVFVFH